MNSTITFLLDGKPLSINFDENSMLTPTTTVLQYLRTLPAHKGTKEGCAEGDCGACTVVLGELSKEGMMRYKSVDSCLVFLPMLHKKQLITVENLKQANGKLHPVQQSMVDDSGSQCGYCTPGFIMSLFSLYKNHDKPSREQIDDALTGNLCRCTGYRPIVEAASYACVHDSKDQFTASESTSAELLKKLESGTVRIQTSRQNYYKPASLGEAVTLKHQYPDAIVISGATDIALRVTKRHELLKEIIDISDVPELKESTENESSLTVGAGMSLNDVLQKTQPCFPALNKMLGVFGSQQIRNLATLGGNLGTASPIGDTIPVLMAYDAVIILEGINGRREIPLDNFIIGYRKTLRKPDEFITAVKIPKLPKGVIVQSYKVSKRKDLDISTVSGAFRLELNNKNEVKSIKLAYGGVAERTKRATKTENYLLNKLWSRETINEAMNIIVEEFTPISDARSGIEFRKIAVKNLLLKFWTETV